MSRLTVTTQSSAIDDAENRRWKAVIYTAFANSGPWLSSGPRFSCRYARPICHLLLKLYFFNASPDAGNVDIYVHRLNGDIAQCGKPAFAAVPFTTQC